MSALAARAGISAGLGGLVYAVLLGQRSDYLGHFEAGFGATLCLLAGVLLVPGLRLSWVKLALTACAIAAGFVAEGTLFRLAIFDPVDFCNQSLGACLACACVLQRRGGPLVALTAGGLGIVALVVGFRFAFA